MYGCHTMAALQSTNNKAFRHSAEGFFSITLYNGLILIVTQSIDDVGNEFWRLVFLPVKAID